MRVASEGGCDLVAQEGVAACDKWGGNGGRQGAESGDETNDGKTDDAASAEWAKS